MVSPDLGGQHYCCLQRHTARFCFFTVHTDGARRSLSVLLHKTLGNRAKPIKLTPYKEKRVPMSL